MKRIIKDEEELGKLEEEKKDAEPEEEEKDYLQVGDLKIKKDEFNLDEGRAEIAQTRYIRPKEVNAKAYDDSKGRHREHKAKENKRASAKKRRRNQK